MITTLLKSLVSPLFFLFFQKVEVDITFSFVVLLAEEKGLRSHSVVTLSPLE